MQFQLEMQSNAYWASASMARKPGSWGGIGTSCTASPILTLPRDTSRPSVSHHSSTQPRGRQMHIQGTCPPDSALSTRTEHAAETAVDLCSVRTNICMMEYPQSCRVSDTINATSCAKVSRMWSFRLASTLPYRHSRQMQRSSIFVVRLYVAHLSWNEAESQCCKSQALMRCRILMSAS